MRLLYPPFHGITRGVLSSTTPAYGHPFYIEGVRKAQGSCIKIGKFRFQFSDF